MIRYAFLLASVLAAEPSLIEVRKIWDAAPHNAFTDLIRYKGEFFCVFREGSAHVSPDGKLRVLVSKNGLDWTSAALLADAKGDLRDAKITVTPDNRLMLSGASALHQPAAATHQSYVWFSKNGRSWSEAQAVGDPNYWLWRITWNKKMAYGFGYNRKALRFYGSSDGVKFETVADEPAPRDYPNEHAMHFRKDGTAVALLRRDPGNGLAGTSKSPYKDWEWRDLGMRIGGPQILALPDGRYVAAVRLHTPKVRTALAWFDPDAAKLTEFLSLPSGGDTSYPGLVWHDKTLWVSYYSSHEGKTSIYLARVKL